MCGEQAETNTCYMCTILKDKLFAPLPPPPLQMSLSPHVASTSLQGQLLSGAGPQTAWRRRVRPVATAEKWLTHLFSNRLQGLLGSEGRGLEGKDRFVILVVYHLIWERKVLT